MFAKNSPAMPRPLDADELRLVRQLEALVENAPLSEWAEHQSPKSHPLIPTVRSFQIVRDSETLIVGHSTADLDDATRPSGYFVGLRKPGSAVIDIALQDIRGPYRGAENLFQLISHRIATEKDSTKRGSPDNATG